MQAPQTPGASSDSSGGSPLARNPMRNMLTPQSSAGGAAQHPDDGNGSSAAVHDNPPSPQQAEDMTQVQRQPQLMSLACAANEGARASNTPSFADRVDYFGQCCVRQVQLVGCTC
jgi:hypothetical protein